MGEFRLIHRLFFDVGYEDFATSSDLLLKYPKAKIRPVEANDDVCVIELEDGKYLFKYM